MITNSSLGHFQLPLFGLQANASATDIGADQRSVFLRPITAGGETTELPAAEVVQPGEKKTAPMAFDKWMDTVLIYRNAALRNEARKAEADGASPVPPSDGPGSDQATIEPRTSEESSPAADGEDAPSQGDVSADPQPGGNGGLLQRLLG
jgi:hypothetical protein